MYAITQIVDGRVRVVGDQLFDNVDDARAMFANMTSAILRGKAGTSVLDRDDQPPSWTFRLQELGVVTTLCELPWAALKELRNAHLRDVGEADVDHAARKTALDEKLAADARALLAAGK